MNGPRAQAHPQDVQGEGCHICGRGDDQAGDWISCDTCEHWYHFSCDQRTNLAPFKAWLPVH